MMFVSYLSVYNVLIMAVKSWFSLCMNMDFNAVNLNYCLKKNIFYLKMWIVCFSLYCPSPWANSLCEGLIDSKVFRGWNLWRPDPRRHFHHQNNNELARIPYFCSWGIEQQAHLKGCKVLFKNVELTNLYQFT